ncbi:MAG: hypothetical protein WED05_07195 [Candidatus Atabeyarchaeum deiterrae]
MAESKSFRAVITLTPSESKRIIGKAVAKMELVNRALKEGSIVIGVGTTNSFVAEEITRKKIDKEHFSSGIIIPQGLGATSMSRRLNALLVRSGEVSSVKRNELPKVFDQLGSRDVFIKGANAVDHQHKAAVVTADPSGGTLGASAWKALNERGLNLVVPVGLEKTIPYSLTDLSKKLEAGRVNASKQMGLPVFRIMILPGEVVTEVDSFRILANVEATPIASGGIGGAEGAITLMLEGKQENVAKAWEIATKVKGEPPVKADPERIS